MVFKFQDFFHTNRRLLNFEHDLVDLQISKLDERNMDEGSFACAKEDQTQQKR